MSVLLGNSHRHSLLEIRQRGALMLVKAMQSDAHMRAGADAQRALGAGAWTFRIPGISDIYTKI
jgi:hypothetical protein